MKLIQNTGEAEPSKKHSITLCTPHPQFPMQNSINSSNVSQAIYLSNICFSKTPWISLRLTFFYCCFNHEVSWLILYFLEQIPTFWKQDQIRSQNHVEEFLQFLE